MQKISEVTSSRIKKQLGALEPGETRRQKLWDKCVSDAKKLVEAHNEIRWQIVALAKKCCVIHHGGAVSSKRYTLRAFAKDVGVPWSTFYEWYHLKNNVYDNLPVKEQDSVSFAELRFIDRGMAGTNWKSKTVKKEVNKRLKEIKAKTATTIKMEKYLKHIKTVHFNCTNKLMIKDCDREVLGEIAHLCRGILGAIGKYDRKS